MDGCGSWLRSRDSNCKVSYLDEAFQAVGTFQAKSIKEVKVNYHPKSET